MGRRLRVQEGRAHEPEHGNRCQQRRPPAAPGRDEIGHSCAEDEFKRHRISRELQEGARDRRRQAHQRAGDDQPGPDRQQPRPQALRREQDQGEHHVEVHFMHQGPSDAEDGMVRLGHQKEGFDEIFDRRDAPPDGGHTGFAEAVQPVGREHVDRKECGENPPDRIDAGQARKQEFRCRPRACGGSTGDEHDDEAGDHEKQVDAEIAVREKPADQWHFAA